MSSGKEVVTGHNYFGSLAIAICPGPVKKLNKISNGDTVIWEGPLDVSSVDVDGLSVLTTTIGLINFWWGLPTQAVDPILELLALDRGSGVEYVPTPAYRRVCYAVLDNVAFGQQVIPPTLRFDLEVATSGLTLTAHSLTGDAVGPEIIYDLLTNTLYGLGVALSDIDTASFQTAGNAIIAEDLALSPQIDSLQSARDIIGRILHDIDASLYWNGGKFVMKLNRVEDPTGLISISEADMLEEPRPTPSQFEDTWNRTIATFHDRENKWEETGEQYEDPANFAIQGRKITRVINFPWVTRREVAKKMARHFGIRGGIPTGFWTIVLKPSRRTLTVGQLIKLSYSKFEIVNRVVRIKSKTLGNPSDPVVELEVFEEPQRDIANDYLPAVENTTIPGHVGEAGEDPFELTSATPRLSWLPSALKDGASDGLLVAMERPSQVVTGGEVWWTWDPGQQPYRLLAGFDSFPAKGTLVFFHKIRGAGSWLLRVELESASYEWLQTLIEDANELFALSGVRRWKAATALNQHQTTAPWMKIVQGGVFNLISATQIDIEVELLGSHGSDGYALETNAAPGRFATSHVYFGREEDFVVFPTSVVKFERNQGNAVSDTGLVRYVKTPVSNVRTSEALGSLTATNFDRNLTTMSPDGTLSRDWGSVIKTTYEYYDIESALKLAGTPSANWADLLDIDAALGAIYGGTATPAQILLAEHIDLVLGAMVENDSSIYNNTP